MLPKSILFPVPPDPYNVFIQKRRRNSGLTSVRWYDDETLFAADFAAKSVYRVRPFSDTPIDASAPTLDGRSHPTQTDLMDLRGNTMLLSNFFTGEVAFYEVGKEVLCFERTILPPRPAEFLRPARTLIRLALGEKPSGRKIHGVRFVPGYEDLLWISYCDVRQKGIEIVTLDGIPIHSIETTEQAQDTAFVEIEGVTYAMQAARTDHITAGKPNNKEMYATLYVYRLPADLRQHPPELVATQHFSGHHDAIKEFGGRVYAANQHDDCVDEFIYSPRTNTVNRLRRLTGFDMPHGLDIRHDGLMAVTNYGGGNKLQFLQL